MALILSRHIGEAVMIGEDITVTIVGVDKRSGNVRVSIDAPKKVPVHREEIYNQIHGRKEKRAHGTPV